MDGAITAIGGDVKGELRGPSGSASAFAKAGRMIIETSEGKKEVIGGALGVTAEAALASGSLSGGFTVMGVRIGASVTGQLGLVGGTVGIHASSGNIGTELGLLAGLGVKVKLDVDFSEWTDVISEKLKDLIKPLVRQKLKGTVE